ncbi:MAG TPA: hypothetical protein VGP72_00695 [Planctomycetota bacterium]|jgi:tetratricopeptide (TPR) repeat protein
MKMARVFGLAAAIAMMASFTVRAADLSEQIEKYFELVSNGKDDEAKKLGDTILASADKDSNCLNDFAWKILTDEGIKKRDLDLGMKAAKAAYDLCEGKEAPIVDTYARAFFETGKIDEAIKFQKKAVELCQDENLKGELEEALKKYEKKAAEKKTDDKKPEEKK